MMVLKVGGSSWVRKLDMACFTTSFIMLAGLILLAACCIAFSKPAMGLRAFSACSKTFVGFRLLAACPSAFWRLPAPATCCAWSNMFLGFRIFIVSRVRSRTNPRFCGWCIYIYIYISGSILEKFSATDENDHLVLNGSHDNHNYMCFFWGCGGAADT